MAKTGKIIVQANDVFTKVGGLPSKWVVERILEYTDIPTHVRLIERGGNERTVTVALSALQDIKQWRQLSSDAPAPTKD